MLFLHSAYELNKAVWPIGHLRTVLTVGELNVSTGRLGRLLLVDCKFVKFGYEPFVFIDYVSRCHGSLLGNCCGTSTIERGGVTRLSASIRSKKNQGWRCDGSMSQSGSWAPPPPRFPREIGQLRNGSVLCMYRTGSPNQVVPAYANSRAASRNILQWATNSSGY